MRERLARLERAQPIDVARPSRIGRSIDGPSPLTKSNSRPIGAKGSSRSEKRIAASTSMASTGCSVTATASSGCAADLEQGVALAQRAVLGHVAAGLAHEPDGRASTGSRRQARRKRSFTRNQRARQRDQIFEPERLEPDRGAERLELVLDGLRQKVVARDDGDRYGDEVRLGAYHAAETAVRW